MTTRNFRELNVWCKAHQLTLAVYQITIHFPKDEKYGLTSQMRRASSSIPANIAEGCRRSGNAELAQFLRIAIGSASELEYHLLLAHDLGLLEAATFEQLTDQAVAVKRMLTAFIQKLPPER